MKNLTQQQLEDFIVTVWEGGSDYWMDISVSEAEKFLTNSKRPFAEELSNYLWGGGSVKISDAEADNYEVIGTLSLEKINMAFNAPEMAKYAEEFFDESFDVETTDCLIQYAIFNEIVYG